MLREYELQYLRTSMQALALIYGAAFVQMALFAGASWLLARAVGARVTELALGVPQVITVRNANPKLRLGPLPSSWVALLGRGNAEEADLPGGWWQLALRSRILVILGPWIVIVAAAGVCLGPEHAIRSFARGFDQWLFTRDLTPLLRRLLDLADAAPFSTLLGIVLVKVAALNLLPIGGFAGCGVLQELATRRAREPRWFAKYVLWSMLVSMVWIGGRFLWAVIQVIRD